MGHVQYCGPGSQIQKKSRASQSLTVTNKVIIYWDPMRMIVSL